MVGAPMAGDPRGSWLEPLPEHGGQRSAVTWQAVDSDVLTAVTTVVASDRITRHLARYHPTHQLPPTGYRAVPGHCGAASAGRWVERGSGRALRSRRRGARGGRRRLRPTVDYRCGGRRRGRSSEGDRIAVGAEWRGGDGVKGATQKLGNGGGRCVGLNDLDSRAAEGVEAFGQAEKVANRQAVVLGEVVDHRGQQ
jgi:hypothetical protein